MTNAASWSSYNAIIKSVLEQAERLAEQSPKSQRTNKRGLAGFHLLSGPTGGGKSSSLHRKGMDDAIPAALELIHHQGRQAILITHRWNILQDIYSSTVKAKDSDGKPFTASVIYAQSDNVVSAVLRIPLPHEHHVQDSDLPDALAQITQLAKSHLLIVDGTTKKLRLECQSLKHQHHFIESLKNNRSHTASQHRTHAENTLQKCCSSIERLLLKNMNALEEELKQAKKEYGADAPETTIYQNHLLNYRQNPWIRRIFPAIAWHDDQQHLLVLTTQKMYFSFYDGHKKVRMAHGDLTGHVVFIDEFDYQADVLLKLLAQSQLVQEPPQCLGQLLDEGRRLSQRLQYHSDPKIQNARNALIKFLDDLHDSLLKEGIDLNKARALVRPVDESGKAVDFKKHYLFRADHLVTSASLTMHATDYGYEIREQKNEDNVTNPHSNKNKLSVDKFLRLMEKYLRQFTLLLTEFSASDDETRRFTHRLSQLLFDSVNDYKPSYYSDTLPNMSLFSLPKANLVELLPLTKSNVLPNTHTNIYGLTNWLLKHDTSADDIDHLRLEIRRAFLPTTPEGLIVTLASRNLVFGLSATAFIERAIGHFDVRWIKAALKHIAEARNSTISMSSLGVSFEKRPDSWLIRPIPYLESDLAIEQQREMIRQLKQKKAKKRKTRVNVVVQDFDELQKSKAWQELLACLSPDFFDKTSGNSTKITSAYARKHRQNLLASLLEVIQMASQRPQHRGQIAFSNSTQYLRDWLTDSKARSSWLHLPWLSLDKVFAKKMRETSSIFNAFTDDFIPVTCYEQPLLLCLLTAATQKKRGFENVYQAAFDSKRTVLILTQTASATNGINLDFIDPESKKKMDLTCLYLLESQHFYFSLFDDKEGNDLMAHVGHQIRNLDKLRRAGEISKADHRRYLLPLMIDDRKNISKLNRLYKKSNDYINNTTADALQQIGRLERTWESVPEVELHIATDTANVLCRFAISPTHFDNNKEQISDLNEQLLEQLLSWAETDNNDFFLQISTTTQGGDLAIRIIDETLIPAIRNTRKKGASAISIEQVDSLWNQLARAILQFDFSWRPNQASQEDFDITQPLYQWACIERPKDHRLGQPLWYNSDAWQFFSTWQTGCIRYQPAELYRPLQHYKEIIDWFNKKAFRTSLEPAANGIESRYLFHPVVTQRLLQGRLGEEAIRALLDHKDILTHNRLNHQQVLELYDFTISDSHYRVDAKYWSDHSLAAGDEKYQVWVENGCTPNEDPLGLVKKLAAIRAAEGENICLVIINLVAQRPDTPLRGFDANLKSTTQMDQTAILVLAGCITDDSVEPYTRGFDQLVRLFLNNKEV